MDERFLKEARTRAEKAVADMPDGEMKLKAFEVILNQLISSGASSPVVTRERADHRGQRSSPERQPRSLSERILALQEHGFFKNPQSIGGVRDGLKTHGWHYPLTTLSGTLQGLVQRRKLRRERVRDGNKTVWKYFNP